MDTPEKAQISTPISSKFEDSPVFNYINSLSPIMPVKSIHSTTTFNSLSFASPPSVFTSPHNSYHKETRFFKRNHLIDTSRPDFQGCANEDRPTEGISDAVQLSNLSTKQLGCLSPESSARQIPSRAHEAHSELYLELPKLLKYDCGSPVCNMVLCNKSETENVPEKEGTPASHIQFAEDGSKERLCSFESKIELGKIGQIEQNKEASGCDWEKLISDAADMLFFDSTTMEDTSEGLDNKAVDSGTSCISTILELPKDNNGRSQKAEAGGPCIEYNMEMHVNQLGDVAKLKETDQALESLASTLLHGQIISDLNPEMNDKEDKCVQSGFQQQRSIRRLVFEMSGVNRKTSIYNYGCGSSITSQNECKIALNEKQMVSTEPERGYSSPMVPGIGLHLNALASTSNDINLVKYETLASGRQLRGMPSCNSFDPFISVQKGPNISMNHSSAEGNSGSFCNEVQVTGDATSTFGVSEEFNQTSPKKKRCKSEHAAESEGCKRCNCKKSKCLKLYCECFAAGLYCVEPCSCQDCFNKPSYEETVLETRKQIESRNPLAFAPKVIISSESIPEFRDESNKTPASARHKRGCNCKKSTCLKKYCECFQGGVGCSISCRCEGCKNPFGYKYGIEEIELEVEERDSCEKNALHTSLQNNVVQEGEEQSNLLLPMMPSSEISSGKPAHSSLSIVSSPYMCTSRKLEKSEFPRRLPKFEKHLQMIPEDETPEILQDSCSPTRGVQSISPNSKRVSPPHCKLGSFPAWKNARKLILRSIPSFPFPSLNPQHENINISGQPS